MRFKQYEDTLSQINQLRETEAIEREKIIREASQISLEVGKEKSDAEKYETFLQQVNDLEKRTNQKINELASSTSFPINIQRPERLVSVKCPVCGAENQCSISSDPGSTRKVSCYSCRSDFNVHIGSSGNSFVRLIASRISTAERSQMDTVVSEIPGVAYSLNCIKKRISAIEFVVLTNAMIDAFRNKPTEKSITINELNRILSSGASVSRIIPGKRVNDYLQMLYWGRLFVFEGQPGFNTDIANSTPTYFEVMKGFFSSAGYNFAKTGISIKEDRDINDIRAYGSELSNEEILEVFSLFLSSYRAFHDPRPISEFDTRTPLDNQAQVPYMT